MSRIFLFAVILFGTNQIFALPYVKDEKGNSVLMSRDSAWRFSGFAGLSGSQAAYYQWVPGNQFALSINFNAF
ncbi:MAG: hypothetical protein NZ522_00730 [Chitinophagales bacterium]|nr:hypothetical protein [Chitinophagales bacterium]